jgi:single-stranded-DNA-specific exonuclease
MQKNWNVLPDPPQSFFEEYPELSPIVAKLLYHRNIRTQEQMDEFLQPDYGQDIHDPFLFQDMEKSVARIFDAISKDETIAVYGDYDADGVGAAVVLTDTLKALGAKHIEVYLPHRETDGYGLNAKAINYLHEQKTTLIITCDCGISNKTEVDVANKLDIDVIITDHHSIPLELPKAYAIIHPKIEAEKYPDKNLAGGGVAFKLAQGLIKKHKESNDILPNGESHDGFEKWLLDVVAIASVADMVPLVGESRTLTKYGLLVLNKTRRIGLKKMFIEAGLLEPDGGKKKDITARTIGFMIAPRINAAGRLAHANVAYKLLISERPDKAVELAWELDKNNKERRELTQTCVDRAIIQVEKDQTNNPVLFVFDHEWRTGIVGLIASRIKEKYQKPTIAMAMNDGTLTGSGRSITGFDMIGSLQEIPEYFIKFGGHPMACGFSLISPEQKENFQKALIEQYNIKTKGIDMTPSVDIDAEVALEDINWELYDSLEKFEPFGQENNKPIYMAKGLEIVTLQPMGKDKTHLRIMVTHNTNTVRKTIGWRLCESDGVATNWCNILKPGDKIDMLFELGINEWNGNRELQLTIVDLKKHNL